MHQVGTILLVLGGLVAVLGGFLINRAAEIDVKENKRLAEENIQLINDLKDATNKNVELGEKNVGLAEQLTGYTTGGDSYFYIQFEGFGTDSATAKLVFSGTYPVRNTVVEVFDITDVMAEFMANPSLDSIQDKRLRSTTIELLARHQNMKWSRFPFETPPQRDFYAFYVLNNSQNMTTEQLIQVELVEGEWKQAYLIREQNLGGGISKELYRYVDSGFPSEKESRISARAPDNEMPGDAESIQ